MKKREERKENMKIEVKNADWLIIWQRCRQQQWQQCRFCRLWNGQQVTPQKKNIWPWTLARLTLEVKERFLLYQSFQIQCPGISTLKVGWFNFFFARLVSSAQSVEGVPTMTPQWCWDPRFDIFHIQHTWPSNKQRLDCGRLSGPRQCFRRRWLGTLL